nr:hypothetical protein [Tanacetum cinerariifolium]
IYNIRTRKIHEIINVNFDEISEMASKQFSLEPGLSNLNEMVKSSNPSVLQVSEASKKDLEDLFHNFYDEYFDSSKIMKSSTTNVETLINEKVFHEVSKSFQGESSSSSLNDDVQQSPKEVILPQTNTQSISNNMIPNVDEASTSHNVFNERLEDAYFYATEALKDADWVSAMQDDLDQFQTQTSNLLHNAIMEAGSKDCPPMLTPGNYIQWKLRIKRYIDTKPNRELIHFCLMNPPCELGWKDKFVVDAEGNPTTTTQQKAIERLKQGESINVQDLETNLFWEFGKFTSLDGESLESYYSSQNGKEPSMVDDEDTSKEKEIDKLMALISLSFKKIYKPTNNNLRTSSNTSRANQDNSPRIHINAGYESQRSGTVVGARDTVGSSMVQKSGIQCYNC